MPRNGKLEWFAWCPRDWRAEDGLRGTSIIVRGIWRELLDSMFLDEAVSISGDIDELAAVADCTREQMQEFIKCALRRKFCGVTECNQTYTVTSRRFAKEQEERAVLKEKNREKVRKYRERRRGTPSVSAPDTSCNQSVTTPVTESSISNSVSVSVSDSGSSKNRKQRVETPWPEGFELSQRMIEDAVRIAREGNFEVEPRSEFEAWHDDCLAHGRKYRDWEGAWRTRVRNKPNFSSRASPAANGRRDTAVDRAKRWIEKGNEQRRSEENSVDAGGGLPLLDRH